MKIAQICHEYFPHIGGVEEHVRNISEQLAKENDVTVFTTDPHGKLSKKEMLNNVKIERFKAWAPSDAYFFSNDLLRNLKLNLNKFDVAHVHNYHAFPALYAACAKKTTKIVFTPHFHGRGGSLFRTILGNPYKLFGKEIFRKADFVVCVSQYEKALMQRNFKVADNKIAVIPNGINVEEFQNLKKNYKDNYVLLYVGRLEKYKRIQFLIRTMTKLDDNVFLEIVGQGPYKNSLVNLARELNVNRRITFSNGLDRDKLLEKYAEANLFVTLSENEAYGIVVAEALASGTPCIVADVSALHDWIDNINCFGIGNTINIDQLSTLVKKVVRIKIEKVKLPTWVEVAGALQSLYNDILGSD
jgi:glycosyltransferase involved in cell wall biosynthesis